MIKFFSKKMLMIYFWVTETIIFVFTFIFMFNHGVCNSDTVDAVERCTEYAPFLDKIKEMYEVSNLGYIDFFGSLLLLIALFFFFTYILISLFYKRFKKWQWYKKIFLVELSFFFLLWFLITMFIVGSYDGNIQHQVEVMLGLRLFFYGLSFSSLLFVNPFMLVVLFVPYMVGFIFKKHKKLTKTYE